MQNTIIKLINKEFLEARKNHKLLIISITFLFFGILSPLSAYYMPQLIGLISADQGISIQLNPPTQIDSFLQFYKNISQMALIIMIFIFMGYVANEKESGSADFILVKPVKIVDFIISKYISMYILILFAMVISSLICGIYTYVLFEELSIYSILRMTIYLYIYLVTILSLTLLFSSIYKKQMIAGVLSFVLWIVITAVSSFASIAKFSPTRVLNEAQLAAAGMSTSVSSIISPILLIIICIIFSVYGFKKSCDNV